MSLFWLVYLAGIVEGFKTFLDTVVYFGIILVFAGIMYKFIHKDNNSFELPFVKCTVGLIFLGMLTVLIPNEKTLYLMAAADITTEIAKNPKVLNTLDKLGKVIDKKLDETLAGSPAKPVEVKPPKLPEEVMIRPDTRDLDKVFGK